MDSLATTAGFFGFASTSVGLLGLQLAFFGFAVRGLVGFAFLFFDLIFPGC